MDETAPRIAGGPPAPVPTDRPAGAGPLARRTAGGPPALTARRDAWHSRGYLPHFDDGMTAQFITYRLAHSVPRQLIARWQEEVAHLPASEGSVIVRQRVEAFLDGECPVTWLRDPALATLVQRNLLHFDGQRYRILAWTVMPTHVHVLIVPLPGWRVSAIIHSWKSYTAKQANALLRRTGQFWHHDYFDRAIRNERHLGSVVRYVEGNPVTSGLCAHPAAWPFGSAGHHANPSGAEAQHY